MEFGKWIENICNKLKKQKKYDNSSETTIV